MQQEPRILEVEEERGRLKIERDNEIALAMGLRRELDAAIAYRKNEERIG